MGRCSGVRRSHGLFLLPNLRQLGLYFAHYNFVKIHETLRVTPAMAAGIADRLWTIEDVLTANCRSEAFDGTKRKC